MCKVKVKGLLKIRGWGELGARTELVWEELEDAGWGWNALS